MKTEELIKKNSELQKQLSTENEEYYGDLLVYLRLRSFLKDENKIEEMLLVILQDVLEAQGNNILAEEYLGKNPQTAADEILQEVPINLGNFLKDLSSWIGFYALAKIMTALILSENGLDIGNFLIIGVLFLIFASFMLQLFSNSIYQNSNSHWPWFGAFVALSIGLMLDDFIQTSWIFSLRGFTGIFVSLIILALLLIWFSRQANKSASLPFLPLLVTATVMAIFIRLPLVNSFLENQNRDLIVCGAIIFALIPQYLILLSWRKKQKRNQA